MITRTEDTIAGLERELALFVRQDRAAFGKLGRDVHPDLRSAAYSVLADLADCGPHRPTELAEHIGVTPSAISGQLQPLETLGLVDRLPVPTDGRAYLVALTAEGHRRIAEIQEARGRRLGAILKSWPERDVRALAELLAKFNDGGPARRCG